MELHGNRDRQCAGTLLSEKNNSWDGSAFLSIQPLVIRILFRERTRTNRSIGINSIRATRRVNIDNIDLDKCPICFAFQIAITY